jgi:hypothetical protein
MSNEILILPNGEEVGTGGDIPPARTMEIPLFADAVGVMTSPQISRIVNSPDRVRSRKRFPFSIFGKNQGRLGSCNGWACSQTIEKGRVRRGLSHIKLSGESVYAQINDGRDQGSILSDGFKALEKTGCAPQELVPMGTYLWNRVSQQAKDAMADFRGFELYAFSDDPNTAELELATALALEFECVVAVHATNNFMKLNGDGVAYYSAGPGNHSVNVDDVVMLGNTFAFDMPNSWGTSYGDNGRALLTWKDHLVHTYKYHQFFAVRSTVDGRQEKIFS